MKARLSKKWLGLPIGLWLSLATVGVALAAWLLLFSHSVSYTLAIEPVGAMVGDWTCTVTAGKGSVAVGTVDSEFMLSATGVDDDTIISCTNVYSRAGSQPDHEMNLELDPDMNPGVTVTSPQDGTVLVGENVPIEILIDYSGLSVGDGGDAFWIDQNFSIP